MVILTSLVVRVVIVVIAVALGIYVWQQRSVIESRISKDKCQLNTTFFGIHVKAPNDVVQACPTALGSRRGYVVHASSARGCGASETRTTAITA